MSEPKKDPFAFDPSKLKSAEKIGPPMKDEHFCTGSTQFMKDAALLKFDKVEAALASGLGINDINTGDVLDQTPVILLSRNRYDDEDVPKVVQMLELLIKNGARLTHPETGRCVRDQYGDSMLQLAAMQTGQNGHTILKCLIDHLPEENRAKLVSEKCKNFGNTALHWATLNGSVEGCECLIDAGSTLVRKNKLKETVLDYATKYNWPKLKVKYEALAGSE